MARHRSNRWRSGMAQAGAMVALLLLAGCKTELYSHLGEVEANQMVAILLRHDIPADRTTDPKDHTLTIKVDKSQFAEAVALLSSRGYPRPSFATPAQIFPGNGLVVSPVAEQARLLYATGQELSHTISEIDGVLSARVQVALPDGNAMRGTTAPASASVFIRYRASATLEPLVPQIKTLVANSVSGLNYDRVSVILVPVTAPQPAAGAAEAAAPPAGTGGSTTSDFAAATGSGSQGGSELIRWITGALAMVGVIGSIGWAFGVRPRRQRMRDANG